MSRLILINNSKKIFNSKYSSCLSFLKILSINNNVEQKKNFSILNNFNNNNQNGKRIINLLLITNNNNNKIDKKFFSDENLPKHYKITLPALSPTMELGTIVSWEKKEGERLNEGDLLAEIETDKATMGFETPEEGYLAKILIPSGTKDIPIGKLLCIIVPEQSDIEAFENYVPSPSTTTTSATETTSKTSSEQTIKKSKTPSPSQQQPTPQSSPKQQQPMQQQQQQLKSFNLNGIAGRIFASPFAKTIANEKGVDLTKLIGTGPNGRIRAKDVLNAPMNAIMTSSITSSFKDIDITDLQKFNAKQLLLSKQTIPHYYLTSEINIDELIRAQKELNEMLKNQNIELTIMDFIIKAASLSCKKVPNCNSSWNETFIRQYNNVNISIQINDDNNNINGQSATLSPILYNVDMKGLIDISKDMNLLLENIRMGGNNNNDNNNDDISTFTITNLMMYNIKEYNAIILPQQSCILSVGQIDKRLTMSTTSDKLTLTNIITVTLSCDHRVVDGAIGATWLKHFRQYLSKPFTMML